MPVLFIAHPSAQEYGSDLQMLETVAAAIADGWHVRVCMPGPGPLVARLEAAGAQVEYLAFPVLRKAYLNPVGLVRLAWESATGLVRQLRTLREPRPDVVLVNTITVPTWALAARLARIPAVCHVHEAEEHPSALVRRALTAPLRLCRALVANSRATADFVVESAPGLGSRLTVIHNGVPDLPQPPRPPRDRTADDDARVVFVGRLAERKGVDVALDAVALVRKGNPGVRLDVYGEVFEGYEWFEEQLRARAAEPDLAGAVTFHGYVNPTGPALDQADVVLVPSRAEPFGNTGVEALLARRPLVASAVQGLKEVVRDQETGILVNPGDPQSLADAITDLLEGPARARALADRGREDALVRFGIPRYRERIMGVLRGVSPAAGQLTVLLSAPEPRRTTNPYISLLVQGLRDRPGVHVRFFSWRTALLGRYDVFHAHWPETLVSGRSGVKDAARQFLMGLFLVRLVLTRVAVVRTVHNVDTHERIGGRARALLRWLDARTNTRILLNPHTPVPAGSQTVLAPHAHYADWFAGFPRSAKTAGRVTYFGSIRGYKSLDRLFTAFGQTADDAPELTLTISGKPSTAELRESVERSVAADPRITANLDFIDDAELTAQVTDAELVVLPYRFMHNSGGLFAALSLGRPVLVPRNPINTELAQEVGEQWVQMFDGDLTGQHIIDAVLAVADLGEADRPNLDKRDWPTSARVHEHAYRSAYRTKHRL